MQHSMRCGDSRSCGCFKSEEFHKRRKTYCTTFPKPILRRFEKAWVLNARGCWIWVKALTQSGYGAIRLNGRQERAHRVSYMLFKGEIPTGMLVMHECDEPSCVNPAHLKLGSGADNSADMTAKKRQHSKLCPEQVLAIRKDARSSRLVAADYGIGKSQASAIRQGKRWLHVK